MYEVVESGVSVIYFCYFVKVVWNGKQVCEEKDYVVVDELLYGDEVDCVQN